jgi:hypothetical protein
MLPDGALVNRNSENTAVPKISALRCVSRITLGERTDCLSAQRRVKFVAYQSFDGVYHFVRSALLQCTGGESERGGCQPKSQRGPRQVPPGATLK